MKYTSCAMLVQDLLAAKRDLRLSSIILELNIPSYRMEQAQKDRASTSDAGTTAA